jgi:hypothetical protein
MIKANIHVMNMKNTVAVVVLLLAVGGRHSFGQSQRDRTFTGLITDSMCAHSHDANIEHARENSGRTMTEKECTVGCVARRGQKYVFVADGRVYQISNQTLGALATYAAETVKLTGRLAGNTITVSTISPVEKPAAK